MDKKTLRLRELLLFALLGALTFGAKVVMMGLPNIEPVSLLILIYGAVFGRRSLYAVYTYVMLEVILFGVNLWTINYLYVWAILALLGWLLRGVDSAWLWGLVSGCFGLLFGLLCTPVYLVTGGLAFAVSWWISGIPFDLIHGAGNFVMALVLFQPLRRTLERLYSKALPQDA